MLIARKGQIKGIVFALGFILCLSALAVADNGVLQFSSYFGGNANDNITDVVINQPGDIYLTGFTYSDNFPLVRPMQDWRRAECDIIIARRAANGDTLIFSTYFGGNGNDQASAMALDDFGNIWITGTTASSDFPTTAPLQEHLRGTSDAFVLCISSDGDSVLFASYLGGSENESGIDIAIDRNGYVYVLGNTNSRDLPVSNALVDTLAGAANDVFVLKMRMSDRAIRYVTYFGGSGSEYAAALTVDEAGSVYFTGNTVSLDLSLVNQYDDTLSGGIDIFLAGIDSTGSQLLLSTYLGGAFDDFPQALTVSPDGKLLVAGRILLG